MKIDYYKTSRLVILCLLALVIEPIVFVLVTLFALITFIPNMMVSIISNSEYVGLRDDVLEFFEIYWYLATGIVSNLIHEIKK